MGYDKAEPRPAETCRVPGPGQALIEEGQDGPGVLQQHGAGLS